MTIDQAYEAINGMTYKLNGVAGTLSVQRIRGMTEVIHKASSAGRRSKRYRETRSLMGDDYTTTVTAAEDVMQDIFAKVWR
jgi:hypothetical protein